MKLAYIITAYDNPTQLVRLITRLNHKGVHFLLHIDKKVKINPFKLKVNLLPESYHISWLHREYIHWGGFGIVQAALNGLSMAINTVPDVDYLILLSEKDYPIKPTDYIESFFTTHNGKSFLEFFPLPYSDWSDGGMDRIHKYHFRLLNRKYTFPSDKPASDLKDVVLNAVFRIFLPRNRNYPQGLIPFGGSGSWCIHKDTARMILDFIENRPDILKYYQYTHAPDEGFLHTILMNTPKSKNSLINDDLHFVEWDGKSHPRTFTDADFKKILDSSCLFARKFDANKNGKILDLIDERILSISYG